MVARQRAVDGTDATSAIRPSTVRDALLGAGVELFGLHGFPSTTVQQIVERANVTKGAFYHWFESKDALLRVIHDRFIDEQLERADAVLERDEPAAVALRHLIEEIFVSIENHRAEVTVFLREQRFLSPESFAEAKAKRDQLVHAFMRIIETGVRTGEFRSVPSAAVLSYGIIGMCAWATEWFRSDGVMSASDVADFYAATLLDGLGS